MYIIVVNELSELSLQQDPFPLVFIISLGDPPLLETR